MLTKKQIIFFLSLVAIAVILNTAIGFSRFVDIAVLGFFVILGCWFRYSNHRKREDKNSQ